MNAQTRSPNHTRDASAVYCMRVAGHLDPHWSDWLGDVDLVHNDDATTTVTVAVADQSQLHGILIGIRDIGAPLLDLHQVDQVRPTPDEPGAYEVGAVLSRVLHTQRLTLRPATLKDIEPTWVYRQLETVNEWLSGAPGSREAYRAQFTEPARLATTVIVEHPADHDRGPIVVGDFMLRREDAWAQTEVSDQAQGVQAELGWVLDPAHTGVGYATEAVRELLRYCFQDLGVHRVVANCFLDNDTSWRLMERVGMRREIHAVRESLHRSGRWLDTVGYALLADEWNERRPEPAALSGR
jgi:RimJ/RimL family protein N-acetyltransferase